ncbi:hypothetical protein Avbf_07681 [Armadillidium vulgare]|nr:hypothetical protein Avbf_07681 [Armadillidium vulgare]
MCCFTQIVGIDVKAHYKGCEPLVENHKPSLNAKICDLKFQNFNFNFNNLTITIVKKNLEVDNHTFANMDSYELLTDELVKEALENDKGKEAELLSWEIKDFTEKGDNLLSRVTSVEVKYKIHNRKCEVSFVAKLNPLRPPSSFTEAMENLYAKETVVLSSVIDGMNKCLSKVSLSNIKTPKLYSKSIIKGREAFLTEDLRKQGFKMMDRSLGADLNHAIIVMEELGRFHARALLDSNHPSFNVVTSMIGSLAENTANYLKSYPKYEKCVKWLNSNLQNMGTYFLGLFEIVLNKNLNVLIHGDFRATNILFRLEELVEDMEKRKVFGFVSGLYLIPSALARGEDSYDFADVADDKMAEYAQSQTEKFLAISRREGPFKDRFLALFDEMLESDLVKEY